ncbi:MAG: ChbG/HpnK family deacetylase [Armatimonadota bacterium]|nr:ChbG/HpnK family deacetylase [Armatimonadota bacterium]
MVVNADDFGLSTGVNRGIEASFHDGILRSASLMPNGDAFADAVRIARQTPALGVGIHLCLVGERCVAPHEELGGLVDDAGFLPASYTAFVRGYYQRRFTRRDIRREVAAQVQRVLDAGIRPTHLDSHQHVHLSPAVFDIALAAARAANIAVIRVPHERRPLKDGLNTRGVQLRILALLCRRAARRAHRARLRFARSFWGLNVSGALDESALLRVLENARPGVNEVMAHPGISDAALRQKYQWGYRWDAEAAALQSSAVRHLVESRRIRLAHFGQAWQC